MPTTTGKATELITFSRGTLATVTDADGKIKWAPHNLLSASEQFDASVWGKYLAAVSANTQVAPNGTTTADTITALSGNDVHRVQRSSDVAIGAPANCSFSIFVKAGTHNFVTIGFYSASEVFVSATFNLASGSVATETDVGTTSGTVVSTEKVDVGNSWFRLSITGNYSGSSALSFVNFAQAATGNSYTNFGQPVANLVGTETFHLWGAHLYRSDLGGMQANPSAYPMYNPTTPKNLLGYSEDFSNAAWTKNGTTITANAAIAPNGSMSADKVVATAAATYHGVRQLFTYGTGTYTLSVYAKAAEYTNLYIADLGSGNGYAGYNLVTGVVTTSGGGSKFVSAAIEPAANGFFRCSLVVTNVNTTATPTFYGYPTGATLDANGASFTGDGTSGIYLWGAQLSDSASLDAYVPNFGPAPSAAAYHGPRLDYDPVTLSARGLLVEEARTNLLLYSNRFEISHYIAISGVSGTFQNGETITAAGGGTGAYISNGSTSTLMLIKGGSGTFTGTLTGGTSGATATAAGVVNIWVGGTTGAGSIPVVTPDIGVSPDGSANARRIVFSAPSGTYSLLGQGRVTSAGTYAGSFWVKADSASDVGKIIGFRHVAGSSLTLITLTSSWQRVSLAEVRAVNNFDIGLYPALGTSADTVTVQVYGAQLELGAFSTSYLPTVDASVTRNADVASVGVSQFPWNASAGSFVAAFQSIGVTSGINPRVVGTDFNLDAAPIYTGSITSAGTWNGAAVLNVSGASSATPIKAAMAHDSSGRSFCYNSGTVVSDANTMPSYTLMKIGSGFNTSTTMSGWIRQITYLPRRLTSAELQQRTA